MHSVGKTLCYDHFAFSNKNALLHFLLQGQTFLFLQILLTSYFCIPVPCDEKDIIIGVVLEGLFLVVVLEGLLGLHRTYSFFSISGWGIDLDYCDTEWSALETNRDHSVAFEIVSKYCILDSC